MPIFVEGAPNYKGVRTFPDGSIIDNYLIFTDSLPAMDNVRAQIQGTGQTKSVNVTEFFKPTLRGLDGRKGYVIGARIQVLDVGVRLSADGAPINLFVARQHLERAGLDVIIPYESRELLGRLRSPSVPILSSQTRPFGF